MVSPHLTKKSENILTLNNDTKKLFQVIYGEKNKEEDKDDAPRIKVSDLISKMSFYYEKIRNAVDYEEEHLLRKNAIERILKRQIVIEGVLKISNSQDVASHLLVELIRAGYLPNNKILETKIGEVANIIEKYIKLRNYSLARIRPAEYFRNGDIGKTSDLIQEKSTFTGWLFAIAASEIEDSLGRDPVKQVVISNMYETLSDNIKLKTDSVHEKDLEIQIYLSIHRTFLKFDDEMLGYILLKYYNEKWKKPKDEDLAKIARDIISLRQAIFNQLNHPLKKNIDAIISKYNVYFSILTEVIKEDPTKVFYEIKSDPKAFPRLIKKICQEKYKQINSRLWRVAVRSIIYIFLTKSVFVFLLEIPVIKWFGEPINFVSLSINVAFPALLLFIIVMFTRLPSEKNTEKIIEGINEIVFKEHERSTPYIIGAPIKRSGSINVIFNFIYFTTFIFSFGLVVYALDKVNFNWVSIIIFLFFLALVSYFSMKIKKSSRELVVVDRRESIFTLIIDFFNTPIMAVGKWLSEKFSRVNVFAFVLDFVVEAPFKVFVEIAEEWTKYVRERKDDIS
ncbi:MAG: hypothetical protein PHT51_02240 [Patescibacteria group bacterium]|nr:hypothetical protein [Patescibacteria group bacterium]MDD4611297.1 hypothetical protein [Patescibacteria group bacterium]